MRILVDTSVWLDHFRHNNSRLTHLLGSDLVMTHPMVIGEIACGTPPAPRARTLQYLARLALVQQVSIHETIDFVEREKLYGQGCGLVDMVLLASTLLTPGAKLWTLDKNLTRLAMRFGISL